MSHFKLKILLLALTIIFGAVVLDIPGKPATRPNLASQPDYHYSTYSQKEFFEQAYQAAARLSGERKWEKIFGLLFNHHLLAPHFIAQAFSLARSQEEKTVLLISPNHFNAGFGPVLSSKYPWQTPYGVLESDLEVADKLLQTGLVRRDEIPFKNEHGIRNIVAFVKRSLPNAKIVPLIIKDTLSKTEADDLARMLSEVLPANSLIAASIDFSHKHNLAVANEHDEQSLRVVEKLAWRQTGDLDVDSRQGLRVFLELLYRRGAVRFTFLQHSNSAVVAGKLDEPETTSYITGYFTSD